MSTSPLHIFVQNKHVGTLHQNSLNDYRLQYVDGVTDNDCISVTMLPSQASSWHFRELPPVLLTSMPEGGVRKRISQRFALDQHTYVDEVKLLLTVGKHLVGRLQIQTELPMDSGQRPHSPPIPFNELSYLLQNTPHQDIKQDLFGSLLSYSGVSGGFDKVLAHTSTAHTETTSSDLQASQHWIVKMDDDDHPALAVNEYLGMELCRLSGLPTPEVNLSSDLHRLLVARFDIKPDGSRYGFEDFCSLFGQHPSLKFSGSMEKLCTLTGKLVSVAHLQSSCKQLYQHHVVNMAIRNCDAHLKNFAILYDNPNDIRLSPVYDVLTMSAYAPRAQNGDALDEPSLTVNGSHRWPTLKELSLLATRLAISESEQVNISNTVCDAMRAMIPDFRNLAASNAFMRPTIARIAHLWGCGAAIHSESLAKDFYECSRIIIGQ